MSYSKTTWTNGTTPINETNLNKIEQGIFDVEQENIIVSATEPTTDRRKVWLQYSKNLASISNIVTGHGLNNETGEITNNSNRAYHEYIKVNSNTTYTLSNCTLVMVCYYNENKTFLGYDTTLTFTTPSNCEYIRFAVNSNNTYSNVQLEQGSTATSYEPFVEDKIYILNDNNVYDELDINKLNTPQITQLLSSTAITQGSEYTLSDNVTNYKYIMVELATGGTDQNGNRQYIPVSLIKTYTADTRVAISLFQSASVYIFGDFYFSASNKINCYTYTHASWNAQLKVYGIN